MNIQLTISLLASDRITTLKKCLDSITPLLRELNSELIIVSTKNNPDVLALAGEYTPYIIPFMWCDDFAKARNAGLEKANGEWFLFLDDDEWFEDTTEIIQFFNSGEYRNYHSATYIQRNYSDWSGRSYTDVNVGRMCRLTRETKFIYPVHENLVPFNEPQKRFMSYVHHYGYVEKSFLKSDRNLPLLLKRFETAPTSQTCMQIALEYYNKEDFDNALNYCQLGLKLLEKNTRINTYELWLQVHLPILLASAGKKEAALEEGERLLLSSRITEVGEAHLHAILAGLHEEMKEYKKGLEHTLEFHRKIKYLEKHPEKTERQIGGTITFATAKERTVPALISGLICAASLNETKQIQKLLTWFPWENEGELRIHYSALEDWKTKHPEQKETILQGYYLLKTDNAYVNLQKALYTEEKQMPEELEIFFKSCVENCPEGFLAQIIELAERNMFSLTPLIEKISIERWTKCIKDLAEYIAVPDMPEYLRRLHLLMPDYPLFIGKATQYFLEKQLSHGIIEGQELLGLLSEYCETIRTEAGILYNADILSRPDHYSLPSHYRFAFAIEAVLKNLETGSYLDCIPLLKKTLHIYPQMSIAVSRLSDYMEEQIRESNQPVSEEFVSIGRQIKQMLPGFMQNGQWQEAYGVVKQLSALLPDDLEILKLKQEIISHL